MWPYGAVKSAFFGMATNSMVCATCFENGSGSSFTYSALGQRQTMADASGTYGYVYDLRDRPRSNATPAGTLYYGYDANGNVTSISSSTADGTSVSYQYDPLNRLTNVVDPRLTGAQNTAYAFDGVGNVQRIQYPCGVTNAYQYDSLNRLTNLVWKLNAATVASFYYQLGLTGNRTNLTEAVSTSSRGYAWRYDAQYRLTNEVVSGTSPTGNLGYGLDPVGNRTTRTGSLGTLASQSFAYDSNDWLSTDVYDNDGNTRTNASNQAYLYDFEDRLTNFNNGQVIITYNADGQRVKKVAGGATTLYLLDALNPSG